MLQVHSASPPTDPRVAVGSVSDSVATTELRPTDPPRAARRSKFGVGSPDRPTHPAGGAAVRPDSGLPTDRLGVVYEDVTTEVHFITVDNVCNELMDTIYHLLHDYWEFPKQYAKERTLETVILVVEVGGVVFAFGDQPGDNFQVHSLCTLRNDFIRLLAERGTPLDAPVASTSAAAE